MQRLRAVALIAIYGIVASAFAQTNEPLQESPTPPATAAAPLAPGSETLPSTAGVSAPSEPADSPAAAGAALDIPGSIDESVTPPESARQPREQFTAHAPPVCEPFTADAPPACEQFAVDAPPACEQFAADAPPACEPLASDVPPGGNQITPNAPPGGKQLVPDAPPGGNQLTANAQARLAPASVWDRIRAGFKLPEIDDVLVRKWENFYAARPEYWQRITERSKRYLYFIAAEIERRGMPLEIALLPIIESAYNPQALSRARASGIWQFIPETGKTYGLQQNWWQDNRRDVTVATGSALDYLENLHAMFGDWQLALASYNWGEHAVQRAISRNQLKNKPIDYASLTVPTETRNYLPKLQAVKNLIMAPEKFGLSLPQVPDLPYFTTVTTPRQIDVSLAARLADVSIQEFKTLNPAHNRPVLAGDGEQRITLPCDKAETFVMNLDAYELPLVSWRPYQLKTGERLEQVARKFDIAIGELKRVNGLTGHKKIVPGYSVLVPARSGEAMAQEIPTAMFKDAPDAGAGWHRVRRGQLVSVAHRYGVTGADPKRLNDVSGKSVAAGHRLRLHDKVSAGSGKTKSRAKSGKRGVKKRPVKPTRKR